MSEKDKKEKARIHYNSVREWEKNKMACKYENNLARKKAKEREKKFSKILKQKKAQAVMIIMIGIGLILLIILAVVGVMIASEKGFFGGEEESVSSPIELFLKSTEKYSGSDLISNYMIMQNETLLAQGRLSLDAFTPIKIPSTGDIEIYCWDDKHYTAKINHQFTNQEIRLNKSRITCEPEKIGELEIRLVKADLNNDEGDIIFNVTAKNGAFNKIGLCVAWTAGFIDVQPKEHRLICSHGIWKNYSYYDARNDRFDWLPKGTYVCGRDWYEECQETDTNRCKPKDIDIPERFFTQVDECFYHGQTLDSGKSERIVLNFKSIDMKNQLDYLDIYFFDHDLRYISNDFYFVSQGFEGDIGAKDLTYRINYNGENYLLSN